MTAKLLPPPYGRWIDRATTVNFRFEGQDHSCAGGHMLCSALWALGLRTMGRSFKYHRPRSLYSLAGHDANVIVADATRANLRGDMLPVRDGLDVRAVNTFGSLAHDRMNIVERFSAFMPVGFYYKAFHTPRWLFPFHEKQMRKIAGLGRINPTGRTPVSPKDYAFCDLLVIGSGPAGLTAALTAAQQGARVMLVEEQPHLGGSLPYQWTRDAEAQAFLSDAVAKLRAMPNVEIRCSTSAAGWYSDHWVALVDEVKLTKLRAKATLAATGCYEQPCVFQNNDLPGVMLASAAQRLMHLYGVKPLEQAVVLTGNDLGYGAALELHAAGVKVAAIADLRREGETCDLAEQVAAAGIRIFKGHTVYEAISTHDKTSVAGAVLCPLNANGEADAARTMPIDCDGIAVSVGWMPNAHLLYQAGGRFRYNERLEQLTPGVLPPGVFAAGRVNGVFALTDQLADGRRAALAAAQFLNKYSGEVPASVEHHGAPTSHAYPIFAHPGKKNFVEFDEDLHLKDLIHAHQEGYDNIELQKRYTTVGMGPSQGKMANMNAVRVLAKLNGKSINETGTTTSRPFHHPVPISHLAGRRFHPMRHTAIHDWHAQHDAEFFHAGAWFRPEYYRRAGLSRDDCVFEEAQQVRRAAGMVDVSTLGKLMVAGPDAVTLLERMYLSRFAKLAVGKYRYSVACDESGVVIEDGVIARLAEDRFYVTATSSGVDAFYREMQRWSLIWKLDVTLANQTGQFAAMNLAGPMSREILAPFTDVELSPEAFPYVAVRRGKVADIEAILMRVGFVGELGYEIHLPARYAQHVWTTLMQAGQKHNIRPFGIEAQRLLRLEKSHIIISQDTDALTNPYEADVAWAIGKDKPFFIGQRSLKITQQHAAQRRLVGLAFARDARQLPEECNLIVHNGRVVGRVTSIAKRSTLGHPLAMAFLTPDLATPASTVQVRLDSGAMVEAKVVTMPFYDPAGERQKLDQSPQMSTVGNG